MDGTAHNSIQKMVAPKVSGSNPTIPSRVVTFLQKMATNAVGDSSGVDRKIIQQMAQRKTLREKVKKAKQRMEMQARKLVADETQIDNLTQSINSLRAVREIDSDDSGNEDEDDDDVMDVDVK